MSRPTALALVIAATSVGCGRKSEAFGYDIRDLGPGRCVQINLAGEVLGVDDNDVAFVLELDGERRSLGARGTESTAVGLAIDEEGAVFGYADELGVGRVPVTHNGSGWADVLTMGALGSITHAAPGGRLVGFRYQDGIPRAVLLRNGEEESLPLPDGLSTAYGASINRVVGMYVTQADEAHGYVVERDEFVDLGTLGGANSNALAVNEAGDVAGVAEADDGVAHAVVRYAGEESWTDLGVPSDASSSNARGVDGEQRVGGNLVYESGEERPVIFRRGKEALDVMPVDSQEVPFVSAHIAAVAEDGHLIGWGVPRPDGGEEYPVRCILWTPKGE